MLLVRSLQLRILFAATVSDLQTLGLTNSSPTNISDDHGDDTDDEDGNVF